MIMFLLRCSGVGNQSAKNEWFPFDRKVIIRSNYAHILLLCVSILCRTYLNSRLGRMPSCMISSTVKQSFISSIPWNRVASCNKITRDGIPAGLVSFHFRIRPKGEVWNWDIICFSASARGEQWKNPQGRSLVIWPLQCMGMFEKKSVCYSLYLSLSLSPIFQMCMPVVIIFSPRKNWKTVVSLVDMGLFIALYLYCRSTYLPFRLRRKVLCLNEQSEFLYIRSKVLCQIWPKVFDSFF